MPGSRRRVALVPQLVPQPRRKSCCPLRAMRYYAECGHPRVGTSLPQVFEARCTDRDTSYRRHYWSPPMAFGGSLDLRAGLDMRTVKSFCVSPSMSPITDLCHTTKPAINCLYSYCDYYHGYHYHSCDYLYYTDNDAIP